MPRTPPSRADQELIQALAAEGVTVTPTQLERWRREGYLPRNRRQGLGRGAGSRSEIAAGTADYIDALTAQAGQGRSMHQTILALFMAGVLQPADCPPSDPPMRTYEAAVRRAFQKEIDEGDVARDWIASVASNAELDGHDPEVAMDQAFAQAEVVAKRRVTRSRLRLERRAAGLGGFQPRTREELEREEQQAFLSAAELRPAEFDISEDERDFEEIWHNGLPPLDLSLFIKPRCDICAARTLHMPGSRQGQHDILKSTCFCELNRARAIGGAVSMLVANLRNQALHDPNNAFPQQAMEICANTVFRYMLREHHKVAPRRPQSIVFCTLFFLHDCRWLRSAAALLTQLALLGIPAAKDDPSVPGAVARAMSASFPRGRIMRQPELGVGMLLATDGLAEAGELIKATNLHPHASDTRS